MLFGLFGLLALLGLLGLLGLFTLLVLFGLFALFELFALFALFGLLGLFTLLGLFGLFGLLALFGLFRAAERHATLARPGCGTHWAAARAGNRKYPCAGLRGSVKSKSARHAKLAHLQREALPCRLGRDARGRSRKGS